MHILALDVGTSSVKAAVLDTASAAPVGPIAHTAYALDHPTPDAAEVPAERLWNAIAAAAREATRRLTDVQAVGLSVMTPALVLLDATDRPLGPIWTHLDRRSRQAARQVWADVGEEFLNSTGNRPLPGGMSAVSYRQQLSGDPYLVHKVKNYLHLNSWLGLHLTGERAFDSGNASFTGLFGTVTDQRWSPRWCDYFDVDPQWLPLVVDGTATVGNLRAAMAADLNVPAGVPVKLGTADSSSAALAASLQPCDLLHVMGTTQVLATLTDQPKPDARRLIHLLGVGKLFMQVTHNPVGGVALDWLRELCFRDQTSEEFYQRTIPRAQERQTRVTLDPAFLGGDRLEIEAHRAAFRDLTLSTDRLDLLAAVLEAMLRLHRQALEHLGLADHIRRIFLTGGGAEVVRQLMPGYGNGNMQVVEEGSLRGVARLFQPGL
jgi:xylulokinase